MCVYVCLFVCRYVCVYVCVYVYVYVFLCICVYCVCIYNIGCEDYVNRIMLTKVSEFEFRIRVELSIYCSSQFS